ncbi:MAG: hypothetical protein COV35_08390 [Alphaproteobacteria bacterium CG11_big_fil_rev_8_21_14_0_20_39_49]|nr:MAG: hypothetical protein COV35_08390 [Alphaproteobacteria bacterium CG11_big_fil_rev_8_21_14_0_20_39_49]
MPPKPPLQSKDIAKIFSSVRNRLDPSNTQAAGDDKNNANITLHIESHIEKNFPIAAKPQGIRNELLQKQDFASFGQGGVLERLGLESFSLQKKAAPQLSFSQESAIIQKGIVGKITFDKNISPTHRKKVVGAIGNLIKSSSTYPLVRDVLRSTSKSNSVNKVFFIEDPRIPLTNNDSMYAPPAKAALVYNVNEAVPIQDTLRSFIHSSAYAFQHDLMSGEKTQGIFDSNALIRAFERDYFNNNGNPQLEKFASKISSARNANQPSSPNVKKACEIHAQFVEEMAIDPEGTKATFPAIAKKVEELHGRYNRSLTQSTGSVNKIMER